MSAPRQTATDVRALVARRVGTGKKVALLSSDPALRALLEGNRNTLLVDPEGTLALTAFAPEVVVAFDGLVTGGADALAQVLGAAPKAELVLSVANSGAATSVVRALAGKPVGPGHARATIAGWLESLGHSLRSEDAVVMPPEPSGLATDAEVALRELCEQLNPDAVVERFVWVSAPSTPRVPVALEARTSVVLVAQDADATQASLASLARQALRPLEVVVVGGDARAHEKAARDGLEVRTVAVAEGRGALATGVAHARGRWLAWWQAGELADREHLQRLQRAVSSGVAAWAVAAVRDGSHELSPARPFSAQQALSARAFARVGCLVDRERLGAFALTAADGSPAAEAVLFARLAALFTPEVLEGAASAQGRAVGDAFAALGPKRLRTIAALQPAPVEPQAGLLGALRAKLGR